MFTMKSEISVAKVTIKGQVTIPKGLREKYGITNKAIVEECENGILLKPLPLPQDDIGSLKPFAKGKSARQLLQESR